MTNARPQNMTWKSGTWQDQCRNTSRKAAEANILSIVTCLCTSLNTLPLPCEAVHEPPVSQMENVKNYITKRRKSELPSTELLKVPLSVKFY